MSERQPEVHEVSETRRAIREMRSETPPRPVRDIAHELGISTQRVYQHLKRIRQAGEERRAS